MPFAMLKEQNWPVSVEMQFLAGLEGGKSRPTGNRCSPGTGDGLTICGTGSHTSVSLGSGSFCAVAVNSIEDKTPNTFC